MSSCDGRFAHLDSINHLLRLVCSELVGYQSQVFVYERFFLRILPVGLIDLDLCLSVESQARRTLSTLQESLSRFGCGLFDNIGKVISGLLETCSEVLGIPGRDRLVKVFQLA